MCKTSDLADRADAVTRECCDEPTEDCSSGEPASCNPGCAAVLVPYYLDCREAFGLLATCSTDGTCDLGEPHPRCTDTYPVDLYDREDTYRDSIVIGTVLKGETNRANLQAMTLAAIQANTEGGLDGRSFALQFAVFLLVSDFLQWCVHNLLHRVPFLWPLHKVHHSIHTMDWLGAFRFHWGEVVVYRSLLYVPLLWLGGDPGPLFAVAVFSTFWGHFNHSNMDVRLGPLGYVFNSPRMHLWHHDASDEGGVAKNFGIVLSLWDFLFGTAYWPRERPPRRIGYPGDEEMPAIKPNKGPAPGSSPPPSGIPKPAARRTAVEDEDEEMPAFQAPGAPGNLRKPPVGLYRPGR